MKTRLSAKWQFSHDSLHSLKKCTDLLKNQATRTRPIYRCVCQGLIFHLNASLQHFPQGIQTCTYLLYELIRAKTSASKSRGFLKIKLSLQQREGKHLSFLQCCCSSRVLYGTEVAEAEAGTIIRAETRRVVQRQIRICLKRCLLPAYLLWVPGLQCLLGGSGLRNPICSLLCWGTRCSRGQRASPAQGPAQIRAESTEQKSSLLFITIYMYLDERVQSFKEKRAARGVKYRTGVANDAKMFIWWFLV